jgi:hypothetical protein
MALESEDSRTMPRRRNTAHRHALRAVVRGGGVVLATLLGCRDTPSFWDAICAPAATASGKGLCYCWASPSMHVAPGGCTPVLVNEVDPKTLPMCTSVTASRLGTGSGR